MVFPFYTSSSQFGVFFENNFVFTDDGKHLIGVDAGDSTRVRVEDITTFSSFSFGKQSNVISTLICDQDSGTLLAGDFDGHLVQCDLDLVNKKARRVRDFGDSGDLGVGSVFSSSRFMQFVFFGGTKRLKVFDLSSKEMLPGHIETGVQSIFSVRVCAVDKSRIFLTAVGLNYKYSSNKSDLYDLSDLITSVTVPNEMFEVFKYVSVSDLKSKEKELIQIKRTISQQEDRIQKLSNKNRSISVLEKKVKDLEQKLTQKQSQHQSLLDEHQTLQDKYSQLEKNISSQEENIRVLLKTNEKLNKKLLKAESKITQSGKRQKGLLNQTKSLKSLLLQQKRESDAKITGLLKKLSILNSMRKDKFVSSKGRQSRGTHHPDFPELIRSLEDRLGIKTTECENIKNTLKDILRQNIKHEETIESRDKKVKILTHRLMNTHPACTEGYVNKYLLYIFLIQSIRIAEKTIKKLVPHVTDNLTEEDAKRLRKAFRKKLRKLGDELEKFTAKA